MRPCQLGRKLRHNLFFWYLSDACEIRRHLCAIRYLIQGWSQEVETCNPSSRNSSHKLPQIWLSLRPPIFNSQMTQIFLDLFGQMTQIFPTAVTPKGYFRTKGDDVICRLCLAKLLYCGEVFDMHTLPEGIQ